MSLEQAEGDCHLPGWESPMGICLFSCKPFIATSLQENSSSAGDPFQHKPFQESVPEQGDAGEASDVL